MTVYTYVKDFIDDSDTMFDRLWNELSWERREHAPRREYWCNSLNRPYTYGRDIGARTYLPQPTHTDIESVNDRLERRLGFRYEGCFCNGYENGRDSLGWHADDDHGINHSRPIAVVTLGAGREIAFLEKFTGIKERLFLESGSLLLMHAGMQSTHLHAIPRAGFVVRRPRVSLTFRSLIE